MACGTSPRGTGESLLLTRIKTQGRFSRIFARLPKLCPTVS